MPEEQVLDAPSAEAPSLSQNLQNAVWGDAPVKQEQVQPENIVAEEKKEEPPQADGWWKSFEWNDEETAKNEIAKLKEVKPQEEIKFANDDSKKVFDYLKEGKVDDIYSFLQTQKTVSKLLDGDVDEKKAADIIKFNLSTKKDFTEADIERKFNRQYGIPKEPVYDEMKETEDEFNVKHGEWKERVSEIKADMILDAKELKPNLEKLKSELVLPDISTKENQETQRQPTQEELDADKKLKETFLQKATAVVNSFTGFTAQVKDKDVDYSVSYTPSAEEKTVVGQRLAQFAEKGFDANVIFYDRWVNKDGTLNESTMTEDLSRIFMGKNSDQKIATEAANQRLELYIKGKKNINLNGGGGSGDFTPETKTQSQKLQEQFWGN